MWAVIYIYTTINFAYANSYTQVTPHNTRFITVLYTVCLTHGLLFSRDQPIKLI